MSTPFVLALHPVPKAKQVKFAKDSNCDCIVCHGPVERMAIVVEVKVHDEPREGFAVCSNCSTA